MQARNPIVLRRAFTLLELLIVIGIIAVLISILLPALNKAREDANTIKCASNMRQLYLSSMLYVQDNKGQFFYPSGVNGTLADSQYPVGFYATSTSGSNLQIDTSDTDVGVITHQSGTFLPYLSQRDSLSRLLMFQCPTDMASADLRPQNSATTLGPRNFSFSFNQCMNWNPTLGGYLTLSTARNPLFPALRFLRILDPADKILIFEEAFPYSPCCKFISSFTNDVPGALQGSDQPGNRHNGYANYCFCDGHVEREQPSDLYSHITTTTIGAPNTNPTGRAVGVDWFNLYSN